MITALFGTSIIIFGLLFSTLKSLPLFDLVLLCAASVGIPTAVPLFLGIFIKRTPPWTAWSTAAVGFAVAVTLRFVLRPDWIQAALNADPPLTQRELGDLNIGITTGVLFAVCFGWFLFTMRFAHRSSDGYRRRVEHFFKEMNTPIDMRVEHVHSYANDKRQYRVLGAACAVYGLFVTLLALIPNSITGRLAFLFCGGVIAGVGIALVLIGRRLKLPAWQLEQSNSTDSERKVPRRTNPPDSD